MTLLLKGDSRWLIKKFKSLGRKSGALIFRLKIQVYNEEYLFFRKEKVMIGYGVLMITLIIMTGIGIVTDTIWIVKNKSSK